jgi:hypothetical protein
MIITLSVWRGVGLPYDKVGNEQAKEHDKRGGTWDTIEYPAEKRKNAERAYSSFVAQGFITEMVLPR